MSGDVDAPRQWRQGFSPHREFFRTGECDIECFCSARDVDGRGCLVAS